MWQKKRKLYQSANNKNHKKQFSLFYDLIANDPKRSLIQNLKIILISNLYQDFDKSLIKIPHLMDLKQFN